MNLLETCTFAKASLLENDSYDICCIVCQLGSKEARKTKQGGKKGDSEQMKKRANLE